MRSRHRSFITANESIREQALRQGRAYPAVLCSGGNRVPELHAPYPHLRRRHDRTRRHRAETRSAVRERAHDHRAGDRRPFGLGGLSAHGIDPAGRQRAFRGRRLCRRPPHGVHDRHRRVGDRVAAAGRRAARHPSGAARLHREGLDRERRRLRCADRARQRRARRHPRPQRRRDRAARRSARHRTCSACRSSRASTGNTRAAGWSWNSRRRRPLSGRTLSRAPGLGYVAAHPFSPRHARPR